ncbi:MAG: acyltransferase [Paludibacter sp.]|nr:acyltransferase [Paludibacter sp.]
MKYYSNIQALRGVAALSVLLFHFFNYSITAFVHTNLYRKVFAFGEHAVPMFFVISGFVITRILLNSKGSQNYFKKFYLNRIRRIFPLYYLFLIIWYFILPFILNFSNPHFVSLKSQYPLYIFMQNFYFLFPEKMYGPAHYWSLAVEEHFYLLWPLIIYITPIKKLRYVMIFLLLLVYPVRLYFLRAGIDIQFNTFTRYDQILLGAVLAYFEYKNYFVKYKVKMKRLFKALFAVTFILSLIVFFAYDYYPLLKLLFKHTIIGLFFFSLIGLLIIGDLPSYFNKILNSSVLQYLGKISYGIYVWHLLFLLIYAKLGIMNILLLLALSVGSTIIVAHISYFYFETMFLKKNKYV